jgi:hypothetical protein
MKSLLAGKALGKAPTMPGQRQSILSNDGEVQNLGEARWSQDPNGGAGSEEGEERRGSGGRRWVRAVVLGQESGDDEAAVDDQAVG